MAKDGAPVLTGRRLAVAAVIAVLAVAIVWWLGRPTGELRLAAADGGARLGTELRDDVETIFVRALARIDDARDYHKALSFVEDEADYDRAIRLPRMPEPNRIEIEDLFEGKVSAEGEASGLSYSLAFKLNAILKKLYDVFGYRDYYVVIRDAAETACDDAEQSGCLRVVVQYYPSALPPSELRGPPDTLTSDIAALVMRGAVHAHDRAWAIETQADPDAVPPYMPALNTPETMEALRSAAFGLQVLREGTAHEACGGEGECLALAASAFAHSLDEDSQRNAAAALGAALIEFDAALDAARSLQPVLRVEQHLRAAGDWMRKARRSDFLRARLGPELLDPLVLIDIDDALIADGAYQITHGFACAMAEYRRGRWGNCLKKLETMGDLPAELQPYANAAALDSRLQEERKAGGDQIFRALAEEVMDGDVTDADGAMRRLVFLKHACDHLVGADRGADRGDGRPGHHDHPQ